ncbi:Antitoxin 1 [hydrothermal vent metagenome]|uniref:Antitoxin 1 n=1 Tax=hydrothermal vent metagenome TaxID=652676 RepID=A0A3B1BSV2_9ZZZZ
MKYPVAISKEEGSCYGVTVPDVPGCFSAGDTLDEALSNVKEALSDHLELLAEDSQVAPKASLVDAFINNQDYQRAIWAYIDIDVSAFLGKTEKATITLPKLLITQIDKAVSKGAAKSRSAFLADSAIKALGAG